MPTLPCLTPEQLARAHRYLASQVATMMGRKFEEGDWCRVYCSAKGIPHTGWSNLSIDVMHGNLGVEHKMLCVRSDQGIRAACGTTMMHPAGTRSIRIPAEQNATLAAQDVLRQYAELIGTRTGLVQILHNFHSGQIDRNAAITQVAELFTMSPQSAGKLVPNEPAPVAEIAHDAAPDMRTGWLLWQESLCEFLYFEEPTDAPNPDDYYAEWVDSGGGRRKRSRNLWVFHNQTRAKRFSITTEAGAKIQPYFDVPPPNDPNLYYFVVQGEIVAGGAVRMWLTQNTADYLRRLLGSLEPERLSQAIVETAQRAVIREVPVDPFGEVAVPVLVTADAYGALKQHFHGVSDEHMMQILLRALGEAHA